MHDSATRIYLHVESERRSMGMNQFLSEEIRFIERKAIRRFIAISNCVDVKEIPEYFILYTIKFVSTIEFFLFFSR